MRAFTVLSSDIGRCPKMSMLPEHFWDDGVCRCVRPSYKVRRFYADCQHPEHQRVIATGLTLEEAQAHCQDPSTRETDPETGATVWFDGFDKEAL